MCVIWGQPLIAWLLGQEGMQYDDQAALLPIYWHASHLRKLALCPFCQMILVGVNLLSVLARHKLRLPMSETREGSPTAAVSVSHFLPCYIAVTHQWLHGAWFPITWNMKWAFCSNSQTWWTEYAWSREWWGNRAYVCMQKSFGWQLLVGLQRKGLLSVKNYFQST